MFRERFLLQAGLLRRAGRWCQAHLREFRGGERFLVRAVLPAVVAWDAAYGTRFGGIIAVCGFG